MDELDIPVFHDDQHGTAIIIAAGLVNALEVQGKSITDANIVCLGAGAAGIASMRLLVSLGAQKENIYLVDRKGVIHSGRDDLNVYKQEFATETEKRTLQDAMQDADVFIGVSGPNLVDEDMLRSMADKPVVFALSNAAMVVTAHSPAFKTRATISSTERSSVVDAMASMTKS